MGSLDARQAYLDLFKSLYTVGHLDWKAGALAMDQNFVKKTKGLDFNHLALSQLSLQADSFYYCDSKLNIILRQGAFHEKSGLTVDKLQGPFRMDSTRLELPGLSSPRPAHNCDWLLPWTWTPLPTPCREASGPPSTATWA